MRLNDTVAANFGLVELESPVQRRIVEEKLGVFESIGLIVQPHRATSLDLNRSGIRLKFTPPADLASCAMRDGNPMYRVEVSKLPNFSEAKLKGMTLEILEDTSIGKDDSDKTRSFAYKRFDDILAELAERDSAELALALKPGPHQLSVTNEVLVTKPGSAKLQGCERDAMRKLAIQLSRIAA